MSHCDFTGNSAYHVHSIAREVSQRGWSPAVAVPGSTRGARELGHVDFPIVSFRAVRRGRLRWPDGGEPDLVHAFTPRPAVRALTHGLGVRYVVHLEDNEAAVRGALRGGDDPDAELAFIRGASGVTAVVNRLLEVAPGVVVWPGYDESLDEPTRPRAAIRRDIGVAESTVAVTYTGNIHAANVEEVGELYSAIARLRAAGEDVVLVKSGWSSVPRSRLPALGRGLVDLGWIRRSRVLELIQASDVLVQPGAPGPFNDYRFPSKLPDYLASGHPVVLPHTNVGLRLTDGVEALFLDRGDAAEIADAVRTLASDPRLRARIGGAGRAFARRELRWSRAGDAVDLAYRAAVDAP